MLESVKVILGFIQQTIWAILAIIIVYYFANPIRQLLASMNETMRQRGIKVTTSGVEIPGTSPPQEKVESITDVLHLRKHYKDVLKQNQPEPIQEQLITQKDSTLNVLDHHEKNLVKEIGTAIEEFLKEKQNEGSKADLLESLLCDAYICLFFERSFQRILGTQLTLLERLSEQESLSKTEAEAIFKLTVPALSFERWLAFLIESGFISEKDQLFKLTSQGREFLRYVLERKYSLKKAG